MELGTLLKRVEIALEFQKYRCGISPFDEGYEIQSQKIPDERRMLEAWNENLITTLQLVCSIW